MKMLFRSAVSLVGLAVFNVSTCAVQAQFTYKTNDNTIIITGYTGPGGAVSIPDKINGLPVGSIGESAFLQCSNLSSVMIPDSVTSVGQWAFAACASLTNATVGKGVTIIGSRAFAGCGSLTTISVDTNNSVYRSMEGVLFDRNQTLLVQCPGGKLGNYVIPDGVVHIGGYAFAGCANLTDITIGKGVTNIGVYAFADCTGLSSVSIPNSVTSIGDAAFCRCRGLSGVAIGNSLTTIGAAAFTSCTNLTVISVDTNNAFYRSVDGVLFNRSCTTLIQCPGGKAGSYIVPESVTNIGSFAFESCSSLTSVTIPNGVSSIEDYAFRFCTSLSSVTIPNTVTSIEQSAFFECSRLTSIAIPDGVTSIENSTFSRCLSLTTVTIPDSVTRIGDWAFFECISLTNTAIPSGVTVIGSRAFARCASLTSIAISDGVSSIEYGTFSECFSLTSMTVPDSVTCIGDEAFYSCTNLNSVTIGNSVTNIGRGAFSGMGYLSGSSLAGVYFRGNAPVLGWSVFPLFSKATVYYLPGAAGWGATLGGRPTAIWLPQAQTRDASFGVQTNQFGFNIAWTSGQAVVVEACTDPANPIWSPLQTNILARDSVYFSDPGWTNHPARFYRLRSP